MNLTRLGTAMLGALCALAAQLPATGDDTELFVTTGARASARPNILFVIDNSASMASEVVTQAAYDPGATYAGACDESRAYYRTGVGTAPACETDRWFRLDALKCAAAIAAFTRGGQYIDKLVQYDPDHSTSDPRDVGERWEVLDSSSHDRAVECRADAGIHGADDADLRTYVRDGAAADGNWGDASTEIAWTEAHNNQTYALYTGNYLNWLASPTRTRTRLEVVKEVAATIINSVNGVNVGLMYFNEPSDDVVGAEGGFVAHAMEDIATARAAMLEKIDEIEARSWTPLAETLYEAASYYAGGSIAFGERMSAGEARDPSDVNRYLSPIADSCQQSYVVLLADGEPTLDVSATSAILAMTDHAGESFASLVGATCDVDPYPSDLAASSDQCLDDLAEFMHEGDNSLLPGHQGVHTYAIGFTADMPALVETADRGGGRYYTADDTASLAGALTSALVSILEMPQTFVPPTIAANAFNRTQHLSDLFIAMFSPTGRAHWHGNLKMYRLRADDATIVDANGNAAVDPATGFFADGAQSFWSAAADGNAVTHGGAAHLLPAPSSRNVYTYLGASASLSDATNLVTATNARLSDALLDISGIAGEPTRDEVIRFIRGEDFEDWNDNNDARDFRNQLGDPLHSQPASVIYGPGLRDGLVFFATNDGFLHALDLATGVERWAFVPREFLDDQRMLYADAPSAEKHYGIDGDLRVHTIGDGDNVVEPGEHVFLYFGMGRGGDFYYGLDVTDPARPLFQWRLDGIALPKLGQTWAMPVPARIDIEGAPYHADNVDKHVLVIGGGYEADQDLATFSTDSVGNALYIVDAYSGRLLWSASNSGPVSQTFAATARSMDYSMPARVRVVDRDGDGLADRLYTGDMGGQVWRLDVANGQPASRLTTGGVIAQLGGAPSAATPPQSLRRFYNTPDIAQVNARTESFVHIGIGSGHRGHPLDVVTQDRFYALRDYRSRTMTQAEFDALVPITDEALTPITSPTTQVPAGSAGWRLDLDVGTGWAGEKVLAEARTFNNETVFSTFRPAAASVVSCTPQLGTNRIYRMSIFGGAPVAIRDSTVDADEPLTMSDLYIESTGGILPTAQALFVDGDADGDGTPDGEEDADADGIPDALDADDDNDGAPDIGSAVADRDDEAVICVGVTCFRAGFTNAPFRTFWSQEAVD